MVPCHAAVNANPVSPWSSVQHYFTIVFIFRHSYFFFCVSLRWRVLPPGGAALGPKQLLLDFGSVWPDFLPRGCKFRASCEDMVSGHIHSGFTYCERSTCTKRIPQLYILFWSNVTCFFLRSSFFTKCQVSFIRKMYLKHTYPLSVSRVKICAKYRCLR
jgi:hypothetical protein